MKRFTARFVVVLLAALLIVGAGFALERWQPVASFFSKDGAPVAAVSTAPDRTETRGAGDETAHPAGDKSDFEQWPDLGETDQLVHALQIMVPVVTAVVGFDVIRRRSRNANRIGTAARVRSAG